MADEGDRAALLAEVDRFVRRAIDPRTARPEAPMEPAALSELVDEADSLGLAGSATSPSGLGAWEALEAPLPIGATLTVLARLGRANAAVAYALHHRALARVAARLASLGRAIDRPAIALEGRLGLGRTALARALAGAPIDDDDRACLLDGHAPDVTRVLPFEAAAGGLISLCFTDDAPSLQLHERTALALTVDPHAHGLDELCTARIRPIGAAIARAPVSRATLARLLAAHQLGLVAIALGAVERGHALARTYATQRRQAGAPIDRHPAVLALLGQARTAIDEVGAVLAGLGDRPLEPASFGVAIGCRARAMPALAEAAHASMQTFGGLGYMRDVGVEKIARDVNALRTISGAPPELALIAAEWERLHA